MNLSKKIRKRKNIIYYNPPFCASVETNIGKLFLNLVKKHFGKNSTFSKILNKNTIKLSYSCMGNMRSIINSHNKTILRKVDSLKEQTKVKDCNCRDRTKCPLQGKCMSSNIIYKAEVKAENKNTMYYIGSTGTTFKTRYNNHKRSFNHKKLADSTALAKYIWQLKENNIKYKVTWSIAQKIRTGSNINGCNLCNLERLEIMNAKKERSLNKRSEIQARCQHWKKRFF